MLERYRSCEFFPSLRKLDSNQSVAQNFQEDAFFIEIKQNTNKQKQIKHTIPSPTLKLSIALNERTLLIK